MHMTPLRMCGHKHACSKQMWEACNKVVCLPAARPYQFHVQRYSWRPTVTILVHNSNFGVSNLLPTGGRSGGRSLRGLPRFPPHLLPSREVRIPSIVTANNRRRWCHPPAGVLCCKQIVLAASHTLQTRACLHPQLQTLQDSVFGHHGGAPSEHRRCGAARQPVPGGIRCLPRGPPRQPAAGCVPAQLLLCQPRNSSCLSLHCPKQPADHDTGETLCSRLRRQWWHVCLVQSA